VYIYRSLDDATRGEQYGGSGFLAKVPLKNNPDWWCGYVVTNWHVVRSAKTPVIRLNRRDGTVEYVESTAEKWFPHPDGDDVAALPIAVRYLDLRVWNIGVNEFVTPKIIYDEDIGIGDDIMMIGRFVNHEGKQKNSPAVRFGNIAMMAEEKIVTPTGLAQEAFLVEVRSLPGYSGSPVFVYSPCAMFDMSMRRKGQDRNLAYTPKFGEMPPEVYFDAMNPKGPFLLGIDFCHIPRKAHVLDADGNKLDEKWYVEENTGMAGVIPAWKITEVLDLEELKSMRDKEDHVITERKNKSAVALDFATAEESPKTQITAEGAEIPIPATDQFFDDLEKASRKKS